MSVIANGKSDIRSEGSAPIKSMTCPEPPPVERLNWLIHAQHIRGEIEACKDLIKKEISKSAGKNEYAFFKEGVILREEGKVQEALESFQVCHKLNPENIDNIKEIGNCLYLLRRYRLALEAYFEAEKTSSKVDWQIFHNIAQCLTHLGQSSKAREYAHKAVQSGKQEESYALLIKMLVAENDLRSAVAVSNAAIEVFQDSINMLTESGLLYVKVGQTQHAFERLSSALALDSTCAKALLGIGCITQSHEEYDVALTKYKLAVQKQPDSVALWNNIGMCFYSKQKYIAAITCLKRALWLSPLNWRALFNLGLVHLSTFQPASAFNFLCAAVNLRPDMGLSFMVMGYALYMLNDFENSLRATKQALALSTEQPIIVLNAAIISYENNHYDDAGKFLERFRGLTESEKYNGTEMMAVGERLQAALSQIRETKGPLKEIEENTTENQSACKVHSDSDENIKEGRDEVFGSDVIEHEDKSISFGELGPDEV